MAEEIKDASTVIPRAILFSVTINRAIGLIMLLGYLYCLSDLEAVIKSQLPFGILFLFVFQSGTGSPTGAAVMGLIIVILNICSPVSLLALASRMLWSFARDRGVPFWKYLIRVSKIC